MFGSSCPYLQLFIARLMSCLRCFPYDVRFVLSLPPVVYSKAYVLFTLFVFVCMYWCLVHIVLCFVFLRLIYVNPNKNLIEPKPYMNPTKNLI